MRRCLAGLFLFVFIPGLVCAQEDAADIVDKANKVAFYAGDDGRAHVSMLITDSQGRQRRRVFTILRLDLKEGGEQKYFVYFTDPADLADMTYTVWKHLGRDDDRWMYLPALDLVKRIAASDKRSSFAGSHFLYEDISGRNLDLDKHELIGSDSGQYKIRNTPKKPDDAEFSYFDVYVDKQSYLPQKAEYYDKHGKLYRTIEALEVRDIKGYLTVIKSRAKDLAAGGETVITFSEVDYDVGLDEEVFSERSLRRPPRKWLK